DVTPLFGRKSSESQLQRSHDIEQNTQQQRQTNVGIAGMLVSAPVLEASESQPKMQAGRFGWKSQHGSLMSSCADSLRLERASTAARTKSQNSSAMRSFIPIATSCCMMSAPETVSRKVPNPNTWTSPRANKFRTAPLWGPEIQEGLDARWKLPRYRRSHQAPRRRSDNGSPSVRTVDSSREEADSKCSWIRCKPPF